jgi:drug/metabolite transporter (DMT)-like permease
MLIARYGAIPREARGANMHNVAFGYALLAGVSMATYIIGFRLASPDVHPALGTAVITGIACFINVAVTLYLWAGGTPIAFSVESLRFLIVVGVATGHREPVHAARLRERAPCNVVVRDRRVGFLFLKEPFTWAKLLAIGLIVGGTFLLRGSE